MKTIPEIKEKLRNIEPNQLKNDKSKPPFPTPPSFDNSYGNFIFSLLLHVYKDHHQLELLKLFWSSSFIKSR
jgi:hypothetical protein